jgi:hypothetical protein
MALSKQSLAIASRAGEARLEKTLQGVTREEVEKILPPEPLGCGGFTASNEEEVTAALAAVRRGNRPPRTGGRGGPMSGYLEF